MTERASVQDGFWTTSKSKWTKIPTCSCIRLSVLQCESEMLDRRFPVERWLDTKEDDGRISLELEPNKKPISKKATSE